MEFESLLAYLQAANPHAIVGILFGILLLCGFGLPLPEDVPLITGGFLAYEGILNVHLVLLVGLAGVMIGDSTMFFLGHRYGSQLLRHRFLARIVHAERLGRAQAYFNRYGNKIFFVARFLPGLRTPVFFTGGSLHVKFRLFFIYDFLAALVSVPVWVYAAYYGGEYIHKVITVGKNVQLVLVTLVVIIVAAKLIHAHRKAKSGF